MPDDGIGRQIERSLLLDFLNPSTQFVSHPCLRNRGDRKFVRQDMSSTHDRFTGRCRIAEQLKFFR